jgi:hypothetical protein
MPTEEEVDFARLILKHNKNYKKHENIEDLLTIKSCAVSLSRVILETIKGEDESWTDLLKRLSSEN